MITPTVGRVVLYHAPGVSMDEAWPALICKVNSDDNINVGGFKANGQPFADTNVMLHSDPESYGNPGGGSWAQWMPYQLGQAVKSEELEKQLAETDKHGGKVHKSHK